MAALSVIVITKNEAHNIVDCLESVKWADEIIIVDNNSRDETKATVEKYAQKSQDRLKYIFEGRQGLCYARNRGIMNATGEIIVFTDDDCLAPLDWLIKIYDEFNRSLDVSGILGNAVWEDGQPMYSENNILRGNGLNMSFRRELFREVGMFDVYLGSGSLGCSADDVEFIYRAAYRHKKNIVLREHIVITHKHRISKEEELRIYFRDSQGHMVFYLKYVLRTFDVESFKKIFRIFRFNIKSYLKAKKENNAERLKERALRLKGSLLGFGKGLKIWLFISPWQFLRGDPMRVSAL